MTTMAHADASAEKAARLEAQLAVAIRAGHQSEVADSFSWPTACAPCGSASRWLGRQRIWATWSSRPAARP